MLRIGEFALLSGLSIKTLRYYDEIDLLKPAYTDPETSYRYYDYIQLATAHRVLAFKNMGLSLSEISALLAGKMTAGHVRRLLKDKRAGLQAELNTIREQVAYLNNKIYEVEMDGVMASEVMLKQLDAMQVVVASGVAPLKENIGETLAVLRAKVENITRYHHAPPMAIYPAYLHPVENIPLEFAQPIDPNILLESGDEVEIRQIPPMTVAAVIQTGKGDMASPWVDLNEWIYRNGYRIVGAFRKIYLYVPSDGNPAKYASELQFPIEKKEEG